jgi:hypothetical protein
VPLSNEIPLHSSLFRLLNTGEFTSRRPRREKFASGVNVATKRPLQNNKRGNKQEQVMARLPT